MRIILAILFSATLAKAQTTLGITAIKTGTNTLYLTLYATNLPAGTHAVERSFDLSLGFFSFAPITSTGAVVTTFTHFPSLNIQDSYYRIRIVDEEEDFSGGEGLNYEVPPSIIYTHCTLSQTEQQDDPLPEIITWYRQQWTVVKIPRNPTILPPRR